MCDNCVVWATFNPLTVEVGAVPSALAGFWEPLPHTGVPCPASIQEEALSPTST